MMIFAEISLYIIWQSVLVNALKLKKRLTTNVFVNASFADLFSQNALWRAKKEYKYRMVIVREIYII